MLTKQQKIEQVKEGEKELQNSQALVFVDFSGIGVNSLKVLRQSLKEFGAKLKVVKKKLLRIALSNKKIDFDPEQFEFQVGTIFAPKGVLDIAGPVYKSKIKILGGYDLSEAKFYDAEKMKMIGQLPSREILLGQLVGMIAAPIKMFMSVLDQKGRKE